MKNKYFQKLKCNNLCGDITCNGIHKGADITEPINSILEGIENSITKYYKSEDMVGRGVILGSKPIPYDLVENRTLQKAKQIIEDNVIKIKE
mgnify:CR=1 FL=1